MYVCVCACVFVCVVSYEWLRAWCLCFVRMCSVLDVLFCAHTHIRYAQGAYHEEDILAVHEFLEREGEINFGFIAGEEKKKKKGEGDAVVCVSAVCMCVCMYVCMYWAYACAYVGRM